MSRSMPGLPVHHQLLEFTQTHVHRVSDAIQPSCPLLLLLPIPVVHSQTPGLPTEGGISEKTLHPLTVARLHFDWIWGGSTFGDTVQGNHKSPQF